MRIYTKLMDTNDVPKEHWMLYTDVDCQHCGKTQSLVDYRLNNSQCIKCESKIEV
jgi:hypothetical protein